MKTNLTVRFAMGCLLKAKENSSHIVDFGIDKNIQELKDKYPGKDI